MDDRLQRRASPYSPLSMMCTSGIDAEPTSEYLQQDYFGMHRFEWSDNDSVEFCLGHGDWIRLLRAHGFIIENLVELRPSEHATTPYIYMPLEWARRWPPEEVWIARKG